MSITELHNALKKQAEEVVSDLGFSDLAKEKGDLKIIIAQLGARLARWNIILAGVVIAAVGQIVKL